MKRCKAGPALAAAMFAVTVVAGLWMLLPERLRSVIDPFRSV